MPFQQFPDSLALILAWIQFQRKYVKFSWDWKQFHVIIWVPVTQYFLVFFPSRDVGFWFAEWVRPACLGLDVTTLRKAASLAKWASGQNAKPRDQGLALPRSQLKTIRVTSRNLISSFNYKIIHNVIVNTSQPKSRTLCWCFSYPSDPSLTSCLNNSI